VENGSWVLALVAVASGPAVPRIESWIPALLIRFDLWCGAPIIVGDRGAVVIGGLDDSVEDGRGFSHFHDDGDIESVLVSASEALLRD
jgi:hypothetical protein